MKRILMMTAMFFTICVLTPFCAFGASKNDSGSEATFIFPSSLTIIEDEAFEGTAVETVVFQNGLESIGPNAFGNIEALEDVYIPDRTTYIADSAFTVTDNLTVHGVDGSNAEDWAEKHGIPFAVDDIWCEVPNSTSQNNIQINPVYHYIATLLLAICFAVFKFGYYETKSRRPQERPELNPIDYCFP